MLFHPGLVRSFDYVVSAHGGFVKPVRCATATLDGHHHMHFCANVVFRELIPAVRSTEFSFVSGEKSILNRRYRRFLDTRLAKRHRLVDYLFNLQPLVPPMRLRQIAILSQRSVVELEATQFGLMNWFSRGGDIFRLADNVKPRSPEPWTSGKRWDEVTGRARRAHRPAQATALLGVERGARACGRRQFTYLRDALRVAGTRLPLSCRGTLLGAR